LGGNDVAFDEDLSAVGRRERIEHVVGLPAQSFVLVVGEPRDASDVHH
jgi:hypothetical protein